MYSQTEQQSQSTGTRYHDHHVPTSHPRSLSELLSLRHCSLTADQHPSCLMAVVDVIWRSDPRYCGLCLQPPRCPCHILRLGLDTTPPSSPRSPAPRLRLQCVVLQTKRVTHHWRGVHNPGLTFHVRTRATMSSSLPKSEPSASLPPLAPLPPIRVPALRQNSST